MVCQLVVSRGGDSKLCFGLLTIFGLLIISRPEEELLMYSSMISVTVVIHLLECCVLRAPSVPCSCVRRVTDQSGEGAKVRTGPWRKEAVPLHDPLDVH